MTARCPLCAGFAVEDRAHQLALDVTAQARPLVEGRISDIRRVIERASDFDGASRALLELATKWRPAAMAAMIGTSLTLGALEGREAVFLDMEDAASFAAEGIGQSFEQQIEFLRQKRPAPTRAWTDAMHGDHDRSFVVAGVTDLAMLEEFQQAIVEGAKTYEYGAFAADFDRLVEKYGWTYNGGREWRIRTIFETNIRTSYMAGRLAQMRDPDVVKIMPWWQYIHAESRVPMEPRAEHVSWDGLVLRWDDPWWDVHFPPNDWLCSCGVRSLTEKQAMRQPRWGEKAPATKTRRYQHLATGVTVDLPVGVGYGWDYQPGNLWERGLVPSKVKAEGDLVPDGRHAVRIDDPEPIADLVAQAAPFLAKPLALNLPEEDYVRAFLEPFGAEIGKAVLWTDASGAQVPISDELFRETATGLWKVGKRDRATLTPLMAEAMMDPDEIWVGLARKINRKTGEETVAVDRRYVRTDGKTGLMLVMEMGRKWWDAKTAYPTTDKKGNPDLRLLDLRRGGKLIWSRTKKPPG